MSVPTYHIYHNGMTFTYLVFGPYDMTYFDVEVYEGHVEYPVDGDLLDEYGDPVRPYIGTVSELTRDSHIVIDVWDWMDENV